MPAYNGTSQALNVRNANNVAVMLGNQIIYFAQTTGHQIAYGAEQFYGIGTQKPQEIQQLRVSPAFTIDTFDLTEAGLTLLASGQNLSYILAGQQYDMIVFDGLTSQAIFTYVGAKCSTFGQQIPSNAPLRDNYSFLCMDVLNNLGNSIMDDGNNAIQVSAGGIQGAAGALGLVA